MPPLIEHGQPHALVADSEAIQTNFASVRGQWHNPSNILAILMIIGGDVVQCAIAQLSSSQFGPVPLVPVAFSFGWVAYSLHALLSAIGKSRLMPHSDFPCVVINAETGYARTNRSWVIGRLLRDHKAPSDPTQGLTITIYEVKGMGLPDKDWVYWFGMLVIPTQLGIAIIPGVLDGNWVVFIITCGGTLLALFSSALPQWRKEKWKGRPVAKGKCERTIVTQGNGSKDAIVLVSKGVGIKLEDLAAGHDHIASYTKYCSALLFVLWLAHLMTVQSLKEDTWYVLGVGALGMVQTVITAGAKREPGAHGFTLTEISTVVDKDERKKVMGTLKEVETHRDGRRVGLSLLPVFFPGSLRPDEKQWRDNLEQRYDQEDEAERNRKREEGPERTDNE